MRKWLRWVRMCERMLGLTRPKYINGEMPRSGLRPRRDLDEKTPAPRQETPGHQPKERT